MVVLLWYKFFIIILVSIFCLGNGNKESNWNTSENQPIEEELPETDASEEKHENLNIIPDVKTIFLK